MKVVTFHKGYRLSFLLLLVIWFCLLANETAKLEEINMFYWVVMPLCSLMILLATLYVTLTKIVISDKFIKYQAFGCLNKEYLFSDTVVIKVSMNDVKFVSSNKSFNVPLIHKTLLDDILKIGLFKPSVKVEWGQNLQVNKNPPR